MRKDTLTVLIFGDIFGRLGRTVIKENIDALKKEYAPDLTLANIENMSHGAGFSGVTVEEMLSAGVDVCTGGDHSFDNADGVSILGIPDLPVIRPYNISEKSPGKGLIMVERNGVKILITNLLGRLYMKRQFMNEEYHNPFLAVDTILKTYDQERPFITIIDFHAETTSEKAAFANSVDGQVSLVFGTHTHVPTADERILPNGTGFITDVGFNGPLNSIIGMELSGAISNFKIPKSSKVAIVDTGPRFLNAIVATFDTNTSKGLEIKRINKMYN